MPTAEAESERGAAAGAGRPAGPAATEPALTAAETAAACSAETALTKPSVAAAGGSAEGAVGTWAGAWRERSPRHPLAASVEAGRRGDPGE